MPDAPERSRRPFIDRWVWRSFLAFMVLVPIITVGGPVLFFYCSSVSLEIMDDCYATEWASFVVIQHLKDTGGRWPTKWDDLRQPYENYVKQLGRPYPYGFDELSRRIEIDWTANPDQLKTARANGEGPPFKVIWLTNGRKVHWQGMEPNGMILDYLQGRGPGRAINTPSPSSAILPTWKRSA